MRTLINSPSKTNPHFAAGFTLAELTIVIIIMGILASIAIPSYRFVIEKSRMGEGLQILEALKNAQMSYFYENRTYASTIAELDVTFSKPSNFDTITDASVDNNAAQLATTSRSTGAYSLSIDDKGIITCNDGGGLFVLV